MEIDAVISGRKQISSLWYMGSLCSEHIILMACREILTWPVTLAISLSHSTIDQINVDHDNSMSMNPIENILTSIKSMFKPSLLDIANGHGLKFNKEIMSSEEMKFLLSDYLCKGCCLSSTYKGCMEVKSTLNNNIKEEKVDCFDVN